jgi:transposase
MRPRTDGADAERLLRSLMAYLRGEPKVWSVVRVPSVAEEDDRRLHRERDRLINERVQHVNRIKGLCAVHGIYDYEPLRSNRLARLKQLRTGDGRELPQRCRAFAQTPDARCDHQRSPATAMSGGALGRLPESAISPVSVILFYLS